MKEERIEFKSLDQTRLVGLIQTPTEMEGFVVLLHGITESKDEWQGFYADFTEQLRSEGYGTLRFDYRGHGESAGTPEDMTIAGETLDTRAAIEAARDHGASSVSIVATSFGTGPGIYAAGATRYDISCFVFIAPVIDYRQTFLEPRTPWAEELFGPDGMESLRREGTIQLDESFRIGAKLIQEFAMLTPPARLAELAIPSLLMHGTLDEMVPYEVAKSIAADIETAEFHPIEDAGHGFPDHGDETGDSEQSQANKAEIFEWTESFLATHG